MWDNVKNYLALILVFIVFVEYIIILDVMEERDDLRETADEIKGKISFQNDAIEAMVEEQERKNLELAKARDEVLKIRQQYVFSTNSLLEQKVPKDCNLAMQWGAKQAPAIHKCWVGMCN